MRTVFCSLLFLRFACAAAPAATLYVIPHTHWEGAVFKTREEYLELGLPIILDALRLLDKHPEYRFVLDQVCYVKPFLERYPEQAPLFRKFVAEGRLTVVGGTITMSDVNMPSGESWVRQALYGKRYYREALSVDVKSGWALDTFGHHAQMPQLLKLAGYESYWIQRGAPTRDTPSEFLWQGLDGTRISTIWLARSYADFYRAPSDPARFASFALQRFERLAPYTREAVRVAFAGADVAPPEPHLPGMVKQYNQNNARPLTIRFAVPADFERVTALRSNRQVVVGELNPLFQGVYSSRIIVKQEIRDLERLLTSAEKFAALARSLGLAAPSADIDRAWEPLLFNQAHDLASGVMVDKVFEDTMRGFAFSRRIAEDVIDRTLVALASRIDTRGEGIPVIVWNTAGWSRTDVVEVEVGPAQGAASAFDAIGPDGGRAPAQVVEARSLNGDLTHARVAFLAPDVPPLGYAVYHLVPSAPSPSDASGEALENEHYRITVDRHTGALTSVFVKAGGWEALRGKANVVAREPDPGDFWQLYEKLQGGMVIDTKAVGLPPAGAAYSTDQTGDPGAVRRGPVFSEFRSAHPFGRGQFATRVRLYSGLRRIDIRTEIINKDQHVRYRALFPTAIASGRSVHEIPFGAIERPPGQEFPAQNWADWGDGRRGVALLNRGLPGHNVVEGTLLLSLARSTRIVAYGYGGGYEPGVSSDSGLELGKRLTSDYALLPHPGDWRDAGVVRAAYEFNHPLLARKADRHAGKLPGRWGLIEVSPASVVLSALKPGPQGSLALRVYETAGRSATGVRVKLAAAIAAAHEAGLIEDPGRPVTLEQNTLRFDLRPFEIKTCLLKLGARKSTR